MKDRWSEAEYVVIHQVANDIPAYEVRDDGPHSGFWNTAACLEGSASRHQ